jgi:hypothetical protein
MGCSCRHLAIDWLLCVDLSGIVEAGYGAQAPVFYGAHMLGRSVPKPKWPTNGFNRPCVIYASGAVGLMSDVSNDIANYSNVAQIVGISNDREITFFHVHCAPTLQNLPNTTAPTNDSAVQPITILIAMIAIASM